MSDNANLFPTLGEIATRTDARADVVEGQVGGEEEEDEDRDMQEIESLCMRCHEQVSCCPFSNDPCLPSRLTGRASQGCS